jgi:hypothetical protein
MMSICSAPGDLIVATSDGIDVRFAGVTIDLELSGGGPGVRVLFEAVREAETARRDQKFADDRLAWARRLKARGSDAAGCAPTTPGVMVLERVRVLMNDDVGTEYRCESGQIGGDVSPWTSFWLHTPCPPDNARRLELQFTLDGETTGKECVVRLT